MDYKGLSNIFKRVASSGAKGLELPEALKALFRPMTVMVPDLILVCENMLMAEGFVTVKALYLCSLLKALLSAQFHCSRGLRAIMSVLIVAGGVKRAEPELAEDALLMRALDDFKTNCLLA